MRPRRGVAVGPQQHRSRNDKLRFSVMTLLTVSMIAPIIFFAPRISNFSSSFSGNGDFSDGKQLQQPRKDILERFNEVEALFPKEVLDVIIANSEGSHSLNRNIVVGNDMSSSLVQENSLNLSEDHSSAEKEGIEENGTEQQQQQSEEEIVGKVEDTKENVTRAAAVVEEEDSHRGRKNIRNDQEIVQRKQLRLRRHVKRLTELLQQDEEEQRRMENEAIQRSKEVDDTILGKYSVWRRDDTKNSDSIVRLMRDQLIMARVYLTIAESRNNARLVRDLKIRIRDSQRAVGEATIDAELPRSAPERIRAMGQMLAKARQQNYDCNVVVKKLRSMLQSAEEYVRTLKKQSTFLSQLAAKTMPKGLHCLALRLNVHYYTMPLEQREFPYKDKLEDNNLYHYALFSDNILAAAVVVNSTVLHAKEPEKHVFHVVTDKLNYGAMRMWFILNPPGNATIQVENVDDFTWLNSSYCPVLRQLESAAMKEYYFKPDQTNSVATSSSNLKYRNPKYLSMLNHLRFYLPQIYPKLNKLLFLDDDVIVQKDLSPLWNIPLHGNVNGAVETCGASFHRFDKYLNFSNPHIARNFDPNACGWAYGMNIFDLEEWKRRDITGIYHKWQTMNEDRVLWKLGTLPPGLITFYNLTMALDKSWHVLGLGYNPGVDKEEIEGAAVAHYNGNLKPWLDIGLVKFKSLWSNYVKYDHPYVQECNIQ